MMWLRVDEMENERAINRAQRTSRWQLLPVENLSLSGCAGVGCGKTLRALWQRP